MASLIDRILRCTRGATAIEYGLIVSLVVITVISGISMVGGATHGAWGVVSNKVAAVEP